MSVKGVDKVREGVGKPILVLPFWVSVVSCLPISNSLPRDLGRSQKVKVCSQAGVAAGQTGKRVWMVQF